MKGEESIVLVKEKENKSPGSNVKKQQAVLSLFMFLVRGGWGGGGGGRIFHRSNGRNGNEDEKIIIRLCDYEQCAASRLRFGKVAFRPVLL